MYLCVCKYCIWLGMFILMCVNISKGLIEEVELVGDRRGREGER